MVVININLSVPPEKQEEGKGVPIHAEINMLKREDANDNEWKFARALEEVLKTTLASQGIPSSGAGEQKRRVMKYYIKERHNPQLS